MMLEPDYKLIKSTDIHEFQNAVVYWLSHGYETCGGVSAVPQAGTNVIHYLQAMVIKHA